MQSKRDPSWRLRGFARLMRHQPTDAEKRLWSRLRDRRLKGFKFRRQVPISGLILDFCCLEQRLAIELDGGHHLDDEVLAYDRRREKRLREMGIRTLRFSDVEVLMHTDLVLNEILKQLEKNPHPDPLPEYREREQWCNSLE